jgi:hypothetical protein
MLKAIKTQNETSISNSSTNEQKLQDLENMVLRLSAQIETITSDSGNFTIKAYARLKGISLDQEQAAKLGKSASKLSRQREITPGRSRDEIWGRINNYPESILEEVFKNCN